MRSVRRLLILSVLATSAVAACSSDSTTDPFAPMALELGLSPAVDTILVLDSIAGTAPVKLALSASSLGHAVSTPRGVEWTSSDPSVATVDSTGAVRARSIGSAMVTARVNSTKVTATVVVTYKAKSVTITPSTLSGLVGDTMVVTASARDADGVVVPGTKFVFSSADQTIATVTSTGAQTARVTFLKAGAARVNLTAAGQTVSATGNILAREFLSAPVAGAPPGTLTLSAGQDATCGILPLGRAYCFGRAGLLGVAKDTTCVNDDGSAPEGCTAIPLRVGPTLNFVSVSVGGSVACGATSDNRAYCWGSQSQGQLGNGVSNGGTSAAPQLVIGGVSRTAVSLSRVSAGGNHACGLSPTGAAFCWGGNEFSQLGNGDDQLANSRTPVPVAGSNVFSSISAGMDHTCALNGNGVAFCWGDNSYFQLGDGSFDFSSDRPSAVSGGTSYASISAGGNHTCAITAAGVAFCWGDNSFGQLGDGGVSFEASQPVAVGGGLRFKSISAGRFSTCGITIAGAAYCWGENAYWQLGTQSVSSSDTPRLVSGGRTDFTAITVGLRHTCAVATSGAYCWGSNIFGALGNELQAVRQSSPVKTAVPK